MKKRLIVGSIVLAGYAGAFFAAWLAVHLNNIGRPPDVANSGMAAGGDMILFLGVFGFVSLFPMGLILYYLRPYRTFWIVLAFASLLLAITGPLLVVAMILDNSAQHNQFLLMMAQLGVLRSFAAPVLALAFLICAAIASAKRWLFVGSACMEAFVTMYAIAHWFLPLWFSH